MSAKTKNIQKIRIFVLDTLFPVRCVCCGKENNWICPDCLRAVVPPKENVCPACERVAVPDGRTCLACKKTSPLDGLIVCASYKNETVAKAIHLYKYRFISDLHQPLGALMIKALQSTEIPLCDLIVPVPLHQKRLRWRGFNQSELLANHISKNLLPEEFVVTNDILIRQKNTTAQMKMKKIGERAENIRDAFAVPDLSRAKNKSVLLVDDVATTGSTIFECARVLKKAGASAVFAIVVARQGLKE